jgi:hypothetical protein
MLRRKCYTIEAGSQALPRSLGVVQVSIGEKCDTIKLCLRFPEIDFKPKEKRVSWLSLLTPLAAAIAC